MMESIIEFVLDVKQDEFNQWIESYLPDKGREIIFLPDDGEPVTLNVSNQANIHTQGHYLKIDGSPYKKSMIYDSCQYYVNYQLGEMEEIQQGFGFADKSYFLSTKVIGSDKTLIKIDCSAEVIRPFLLDLFHKMMIKWPQSKRELLKLNPSPFIKKDEKMVFQMKIKVDPQTFFNWLEELIAEDEHIFYEEKINDKIYKTSIHESEMFTPNKDYCVWEILIFATTHIAIRDEIEIEVKLY